MDIYICMKISRIVVSDVTGCGNLPNPSDETGRSFLGKVRRQEHSSEKDWYKFLRVRDIKNTVN